MSGIEARGGSVLPADTEPPPSAGVSDLATRTTSAGDGGLRRRAARGTIVNAGFMIGLAGLGLLQRVIVAKFLLPAQLGLWTVVLLAILTVVFLKNAGVGDKFVQQDEVDQELAFQKAFTIDLMLAVVCVVVAAIALPLVALAYGKAAVIAPGLVLSLGIVGNSLQAPVWIHYRRMDYAAQRMLLAVDPAVTFIVTIVLAVAGAGTWSLVLGVLVGSWTGGLNALRMSPYPIALRFERETAREYFSFSWPVVVASGSGMLIAQAALLVGARTAGLARAGGIGLAESVSSFTDGVDGIVTQTLYPAICAVRDRADLLLESFVKSNRLALLWGMPFGLGVAVFASDIVHFIVGEKWRFAIDVIRAFAIVAAFDQLGFNWTAFLRALNRTRPLAVLGIVNVVAFFTITIPLFIAFGMRGLALGWLALGAATLSSRTYYLKRLFPDFSMSRHALRAMLPSVPAVGAILLIRVLFGTERTLLAALAALLLYVAIAVGASLTIERALLREAIGYLRPRSSATAGT